MSLTAAKTANTYSVDDLYNQEVDEVLAGLMCPQKYISPKYFYDQVGSELFDQICELAEYYPTRTEQLIMRENLPEIAQRIGPHAAVIEFGAGSKIKATQLLSGLLEPAAYVPVEISGEYLLEQAAEMRRFFPQLSIQPVVADFTKPFDLPSHRIEPKRNVVFFPGSTIGNFTRPDALDLLRIMKLEASKGGALIIGVDLVKDPGVLEAAYNDKKGITAAFNLNVLDHLNRGIGGNLQTELFRHLAVYDEDNQRIEMRLIARVTHTAKLADHAIRFAKDEYIVTEYSHKYTVEGFRKLARDAGWRPEATWLDANEYFSVHYMTPHSL